MLAKLANVAHPECHGGFQRTGERRVVSPPRARRERCILAAVRDDGLFGTTQDITDRKRAEEQLIEAIEAVSEGFVLFDRDDRYVLTNTKYREMYPELVDMFVPGTPYETMLRTGIARRLWVIEGDPEEWVRQEIEWHRTATASQERRLTDGRWTRLTERRTHDGGIVGIRTDITELRRSEEALRAAQQQLTDAVESISEGFVLFDREDRYVLTNSNYRRLYPGIADLCEPGASFEAVMRANIERGLHEFGAQGPEAWLQGLREWHRRCGEPMEPDPVRDALRRGRGADQADQGAVAT